MWGVGNRPGPHRRAEQQRLTTPARVAICCYCRETLMEHFDAASSCKMSTADMAKVAAMAGGGKNLLAVIEHHAWFKKNKVSKQNLITMAAHVGGYAS